MLKNLIKIKIYSYTTGILSRKAVFTRILAKYFAICGMITKIAFLALNYGLLLIKRHQRRKIIVIYSLCVQKSDLYGTLCVREKNPEKIPRESCPPRKITPWKYSFQENSPRKNAPRKTATRTIALRKIVLLEFCCFWHYLTVFPFKTFYSKNLQRRI